MKQTIIYSLVAVAIAASATVGIASAFGPNGGSWGEGSGWAASMAGMPMGIARGNPVVIENLAETLGLEIEDLQAARQEGKTISDLLEEQGIEPADFCAEIQQSRIEAMEARLAQLVSEGKIEQEKADERLEKMEEQMENIDCEKMLEKGPRGMGRGRFRGMGMGMGMGEWGGCRCDCSAQENSDV